MKVLLNSYACCPGMGSEPGMGWNWIVSIALYCEVYVISEGEFRGQVEAWAAIPANQDLGKRMHFYWNPVSSDIRNMCWNQGDWRFYKYYSDWQKKTADIARNICKTERIDILHQLNMIGFREPGYLWQVSRETGIPFVWGPIGGLKLFPIAYCPSGIKGLKMKFFLWLKNTITKWQICHDERVVSALKQASVLISSIPDSYNAIKRNHGMESIIIPETGCKILTNIENGGNRFMGKELNVLWVGKFDFRKRLDIAMRAIAATNNPYIRLKVFGTGNKEQVDKAMILVDKLNVKDKVDFMGNCSNEIVNEEMRSADLFLFSSVSEDTSTVVLEAVSNNLPVLCFDICGMSAVIDEQVGRKVSISSPRQSCIEFARELNWFYDNRAELISRSDNCRQRAKELSWDNKAKQMLALYDEALKRNSMKD